MEKFRYAPLRSLAPSWRVQKQQGVIATGLSEWPALFGVNRKNSKASLSSHCASLHFYRWDKPGAVTITTCLSILFFSMREKGWESNKADKEKRGSGKKKRRLSLTSHEQVYQFWFWYGWGGCVTRRGAAERGGSRGGRTRKYSFSWQTQETETEVQTLRNPDNSFYCFFNEQGYFKSDCVLPPACPGLFVF